MRPILSLLRRPPAIAQHHSQTRSKSELRSRLVTRRQSLECGQVTTLVDTERGPAATLPPPRGAVLGAAWTMWALGCGTVVYATPIHSAPRPLVPRSAQSVEILVSGPPSEPYVDVALLEVRQDEGFNRQGMDYMIQRVREKAGELGCDAVLLDNRGERAGTGQGVPFAFADPDARTLLASCIVYAAPMPETAPAVAVDRH
jgi:hypothetical protein